MKGEGAGNVFWRLIEKFVFGNTYWSSFFLLHGHPDYLMSKVRQTDALIDFKIKTLYNKWRKIVNLTFWLPVFPALLLPKNITSSLTSSGGNTWDLLGRDFCVHGVQHVQHIQIHDEKLWHTISCTSLQRSLQLSIKGIGVIYIILVSWRQPYKLNL